MINKVTDKEAKLYVHERGNGSFHIYIMDFAQDVLFDSFHADSDRALHATSKYYSDCISNKEK